MIKRQTTKELIAESLKELFAHKSADKITVKEIAHNCGITPATFYNHFRDKYDLIVWIYAEPVKNIVCQLVNENYTLRDSIFDVLKYFTANRKFILNAIMHTSGQDSFIYHVFKINFSIICDVIKENRRLEKLPIETEMLLKLYVYGSVQLICEWLVNDMPIPLEKFVTILEKGLPAPLRIYFYESQIS